MPRQPKVRRTGRSRGQREALAAGREVLRRTQGKGANKENDPPLPKTRQQASAKARPNTATLPASNFVIASLKKRLYAGNRRVKTLESRVSALKTENKELHTENKDLKQSIASLKDRLRKTDENLHILTWELNRCRADLEEHQNKARLAEFRLGEIRGTLRQTEEKHQRQVSLLQTEADRVVAQYMEELDKQRGDNSVLRKAIGKLKRQVQSIPVHLKRAVDADARRRARLGYGSLQDKAVYRPGVRRLVVLLKQYGCSQNHIGKLLKEIGGLLGVPLKHEMSRRTARRCILEAGVAATIQVGHMLANAAGACSFSLTMFILTFLI